MTRLSLSIGAGLLNTAARATLFPKSHHLLSATPRRLLPPRSSLSFHISTMADAPDAGMDAVQRRLMFEDE